MPENDQRAAPRFMIRLKGGEAGHKAEVTDIGPMLCELQDISAGGLRAKLVDHAVRGMPLREEQTLELNSFVSDKFAFIEGATGAIAWTNDAARQFGVRFDAPIPQDEVEALIFHFTSIFS